MFIIAIDEDNSNNGSKVHNGDQLSSGQLDLGQAVVTLPLCMEQTYTCNGRTIKSMFSCYAQMVKDTNKWPRKQLKTFLPLLVDSHLQILVQHDAVRVEKLKEGILSKDLHHRICIPHADHGHSINRQEL